MESLKVVVIGDGAVGKSCFLITWTTSSFPGEYVPTVFDNYSQHMMYRGKPVSIFLWDTAGQEDYDRLRPLSYPGTNVFLVCYSISSRTSLENVRSKWVPEITHHCPGVPFILLGLKADLKIEGQDYISSDEGNQVAKEIGASGFFEASSLNYMGLSDVMNGVAAVGLTFVERPKARGFNFFRRKKKSNKQLLTGAELEPTIPAPPSLPIGQKAPWINIDSSTLSQEWKKLINQEEFSDVHFILADKTFFTHKFVLVASSDVMRRLFDVQYTKQVESLLEDRLWSRSRLKDFSPDRINDGKEDGFLSFVQDNQSGDQSSNAYITLDSEKFTELSFKRCLEFMYTGYIDLNKDSEGLDDTIKAAKLLNLPELFMICQNAQQEQEFLNPSIGTWLNDRNSAIAKELFLNKPLMSDVKFNVEGETVYGHKIVLAARCDVLGAMLTGGFAESNSSEINLPEVSHETFLALLEYLYTDHSPIEDSDSISILTVANQYVLPRLMNLCELYITKQVDKACAKSIADSEIDIIGLLLTAQLHNANQLSGWCLHFIASNYIAFENSDHFDMITGDNKTYVEENRWPPLSYIKAMEEYKEKYGIEEDNGSGSDDEGDSDGAAKGRRRNKDKNCTTM